MFTGIIEQTGVVDSIEKVKTNIRFGIKAPFVNELSIDQSVAHNGVCLTVVEILDGVYYLDAIQETLDKTNLGKIKVGDKVNLERCMQAKARFDGHIVQGHVDQVAVCKQVEDQQGSWKFTFAYDASKGNVTVEKGSVCINGISLTVVDSKEGQLSVAIIPYTYDFTNLHQTVVGSTVNIEFDIIGKYVQRITKGY
ncbi:MAG: riboflavin synthase [Cyclobacteriaceae bacterium]